MLHLFLVLSKQSVCSEKKIDVKKHGHCIFPTFDGMGLHTYLRLAILPPY